VIDSNSTEHNTPSVKQRLFTPGPTPVPEHVLLRMAEPVLHHRHPEFRAIMERVNRNLQYLFQTEGPVVSLTCSGTGGMEALIQNLFSPGETVIAVNGGKFGERWVMMPRAFGLNVVEVVIPWGQAVSTDRIITEIRRHPGAKAVCLTHSETSTGTAIDLQSLSQAIRSHGSSLICVDGISSVGAHELRFDAWGIDACITGSQKGLMIPPGLAFVGLSTRALAAMSRSTMPRFYFDLQRAVQTWEKADTPWTPAVSLFVALDAALERIREEGLENVWKRHRRLALAIRAGISALGLKLFSSSPSFAVTAVWLPPGVDWKLFNRTLRSELGMTIAAGQGDYSGKIFRIAHLGYYDEMDAITCIAAMEQALARHNHPLKIGAGVTAAQKSLAESRGL
jgi:aspartate aminotransferase-like enzyme